MIYVDTSALVPLFIREAKSEAVLAWLETADQRLTISEWTLVEFASAAAIKVRTGQITAHLAKRATVGVHEFARKHCTVAVPGRAEFNRAVELVSIKALKLRAGDALHLAIAASSSARGILCLDEAMIESARLLGMNVVAV